MMLGIHARCMLAPDIVYRRERARLRRKAFLDEGPGKLILDFMAPR